MGDHIADGRFVFDDQDAFMHAGTVAFRDAAIAAVERFISMTTARVWSEL
jgi:hypothetical protein